MNGDPSDDRLRRLERKVDTITWWLRVQTSLLALLSIAYVLQLSRYILFFLLIAIPIIFVFRRSLPQVARYVGVASGLWDRRRVKVGEPPT